MQDMNLCSFASRQTHGLIGEYQKYLETVMTSRSHRSGVNLPFPYPNPTHERLQ